MPRNPPLPVLVLLLSALASLVLGGCARRVRLTPAELERVERRVGSTDPLRVFVHRKVIVRWDPEDVTGTFEVDRVIKERIDVTMKLAAIERRDAGKIVGVGERNGMPLLWVSFDSATCRDPSCALGFVRTEDSRYKLVALPAREGYKEPVVFRRNERRRNVMKLAKAKALGEANHIYMAKRRRRGLPVHLDVKRDAKKRERRDVEKARGFK
ncbi:MAG: hypothetical protein IPK80_33340 [Nannocystis sp.]|nr:hypothetical protein [Nannocystis sp.]